MRDAYRCFLCPLFYNHTLNNSYKQSKDITGVVKDADGAESHPVFAQ